MLFQESETTELKEIVTDDIKKETNGDRFEEMRCLNQKLTFEMAGKEFENRKIDFGLQQMRSLKLIDQDGLYSNLGLLLSDQCVHTIKVAAFQGFDRPFSGIDMNLPDHYCNK